MNYRIEIQVSEDGLFGGWIGMELYDVEQSVIEYTVQLCEALSEVFPPKVSISVTPGDDSVVVQTDDDRDQELVGEITARVYQSRDWLV
jgi:hypothetical protein